MKKRSWKTTLGGWLSALGTIAAGILVQSGRTNWVPVALGAASLGHVITGQSARDNKVTSEEAGAKPGNGVRL